MNSEEVDRLLYFPTSYHFNMLFGLYVIGIVVCCYGLDMENMKLTGGFFFFAGRELRKWVAWKSATAMGK
jgi:hypothetical protein